MIPTGVNILLYMLVFTRVSVCLMLLPGFSANQIPANIRLYVAFGVSISVFSLINFSLGYSKLPDPSYILWLLVGESLIAATLALPVRFLFLAMSFLGEIITQIIGLNPIPGTPIGDNQSSTVLSGLFNITSIVLFFSTGFQFTFIFALASSFDLYPPGEIFSVSTMLMTITDNLGSAFNIALRLGSPILIYAIVANSIAGIVNKLTPQIPVYFVSTPFLICGGLVLLIWIGDDMLILFHLEVSRYLDELF